jgi:hypothetical protein
MKNTVFWDVAPCSYFVNRRFGGTYRLHLQGRKNPRAMNQSEWEAVHIPEDSILQLTNLHGLLLVAFLAYSSTLKIEAVYY